MEQNKKCALAYDLSPLQYCTLGRLYSRYLMAGKKDAVAELN